MTWALPVAGGTAAADGPLPIGDLIAVGILGGALIYDAIYDDADSNSDSSDDSDSGKSCPKDDDDDRCDKEWSGARKVCRQLIYEEMEQAAGRKKKRSVTGVTGGFKDVETCARGLVSQQCGGNKVRF